jgi:Rha family phage regulatory protein
MLNLVEITDQKAVTTSLIISDVFDKHHKNILRAIERLECSEEFGRLNFEPSSYLNEQNKPQPMFNITRDGFMWLAMGFTGKPAAEFKEKFIEAFNAMEKPCSTVKAKSNVSISNTTAHVGSIIPTVLISDIPSISQK